MALNSDGKYTLTRESYAALQAITTIRKYGWQKRAYILNTIVYIVITAYTLSRILWEGAKLIYLAILALMTLWFIYYSY